MGWIRKSESDKYRSGLDWYLLSLGAGEPMFENGSWIDVGWVIFPSGLGFRIQPDKAHPYLYILSKVALPIYGLEAAWLTARCLALAYGYRVFLNKERQTIQVQGEDKGYLVHFQHDRISNVTWLSGEPENQEEIQDQKIGKEVMV